MTPEIRPTVPLDAPEADRLQAASVAIEALRHQRAERRVGRQDVAEQRSSPVNVPAPPARNSSLAGPNPMLSAACVAAVAATGGFLLARATLIVPGDQTVVAPEPATSPRGARLSALELENGDLRATVSALESETTRLESELLRADLARYTAEDTADTTVLARANATVPLMNPAASSPATPPATLSANTAANTAANPVGGDTSGATAADGPSIPTGPDTDATDVDPSAGGVEPDEAARLLAAAGVDELAIPAIVTAFERARRQHELIEIGRQNPTSNFATVSEARRQVHDELVAAIGVDDVIAGRHALGEPNRLAFALVDPSAQASGALQTGDVLLSVDGERVIDLEQLGWLENEAGDRADDAGESAETHLLVVLRDGEQVTVAFDAPLGTLLLEEDSVLPAPSG